MAVGNGQSLSRAAFLRQLGKPPLDTRHPVTYNNPR
jgi:hypothetical protein